ncbi:MAG: SDR family oxidoreductase [Bacteroidia bacterium]
MKIDLTGKTAIVGGASKGIGKATALILARAGANVVILARNEEELQKAFAELDKSKGQHHTYIKADYNQPDELRTKVETLMEEAGVIHILVNNTGGPPPGPAHTADTAAYEQAFRQHLISNQVMVQTVLEGMKKVNYGRIINIISTSVKQPLKGLGVSNTIRGAVANWSKTLSLELASFGITVNNILPGATKTDRLKGIISNKAEKAGKTVAEITEEMQDEIPAGRFAHPEELGYAVCFLASPFASHINGVNLPVDGGRTSCL